MNHLTQFTAYDTLDVPSPVAVARDTCKKVEKTDSCTVDSKMDGLILVQQSFSPISEYLH